MCSGYETRQNSDKSSLQILSLVKISQVQGAKGSLSCKGIKEAQSLDAISMERGTPESVKIIGCEKFR